MERAEREAVNGGKVVPIGRHRTVPIEDRLQRHKPESVGSCISDISPFIVFRRDHSPTSEWWLIAGETSRLRGRVHDGWRRDSHPEIIGDRIGWRPIVASLVIVGPFWLLFALLVIVL